MLVTKSLAGVIEHNMKYANKGSTLVLKPRADVPKQNKCICGFTKMANILKIFFKQTTCMLYEIRTQIDSHQGKIIWSY